MNPNTFTIKNMLMLTVGNQTCAIINNSKLLFLLLKDAYEISNSFMYQFTQIFTNN